MRTSDEHTRNLRALIRCVVPLHPIVRAIEGVSADFHAPPLAIVTAADCIAVLDLYLTGERSAGDLVDWSRALAVREDVEFESGAVGSAVYRLAHSDFEGAISTSVVRQLWRELGSPA